MKKCRPQAFVQELFKLAGRPFKESKHQEPCQRQVHLGLLNDFLEFQTGSISIKPRLGKIDELLKIMRDMILWLVMGVPTKVGGTEKD